MVCILFSQSHVDKQKQRMATSLLALGLPGNNFKLYLAGYYWDDDASTVSFTIAKGYGMIRPNGNDLDIRDATVVGYDIYPQFCQSSFLLTWISDNKVTSLDAE